MKKAAVLTVIFLLTIFSTQSFSQNKNITGKWKTIDDETGKPKSVVEIYKKDNGKFYGKIVKLFRKEGEEQDPVMNKGDKDDPRFGKKILGMEILTNLAKDGDEYVDGEILDPKKGKVYDCKLWVEDGKLQVRGYLLFFHRTQQWLPYDEKD